MRPMQFPRKPVWFVLDELASLNNGLSWYLDSTIRPTLCGNSCMYSLAVINLPGTNDTSATNEIREMAQRSELYLLRRAHGIYYNLVPLLTLGSIEALCLAGKGNARIDVNVM